MQEQHSRLPQPYNAKDASQVVQAAERINKNGDFGTELDSSVVEKLAHTAAGELSPMAALFGGIVGQEALKAISGKFHPLFQFLYFDSIESLPAQSPSEEDCQPKVDLLLAARIILKACLNMPLTAMPVSSSCGSWML